MTSINYDLEIFDDLIGGSLCPENVNNGRIPQLVDYLQKNRGNCRKMTVATVKKRNQIQQIHSIQHLTNAHPMASMFESKQTELFEWQQCSSYIQNLIAQLKINRKKVTNVQSRDKHSLKQICIEYEADWNELPLDQLKYSYFSTLLKKECEMIRKRIKSNFFKLEDKQNTDFYIHRLQRYLVDVSYDMMRVYNFNLDKLNYSLKEQYTDEDIYAMVYMHLEELIGFVEKNYLQHIDKNVPVPFNTTLLSVYGLNEKIKFIHEQLDKSNLADKFKHCIQQPLFKVSSRSLEARMTYRELMYHTFFILKLNDVLSLENELNQDRLIAFCYEVNFNNFNLVQFLTDELKLAMEESTNLEEINQHLRKELKSVNQQQLHTRKSFDDKSQSLKEIMIHWIEQEILFSEAKTDQSKFSAPKAILPTRETSKIEINFSVQQLGLLLRLFNDTKMIHSSSKQELMRIVAGTVRTSKVNDISIKSLHNSFYEHDDQTIDAVKHQLIQMLGILKSGKI